jgi:hypothetical protein
LSDIERNLDTLAEKINEEYRRSESALGDGFPSQARTHWLRVGELLSEAKTKCPHETWQTWLAGSFAGPVEVAQDLLELYATDRALRNLQDFVSDDSNLTREGLVARDRLLGDLEAMQQEHRLD